MDTIQVTAPGHQQQRSQAPGFDLDRTILLTGAGGLLGQAIKKRLLRDGASNVLCPARRDLDLTDARAVRTYFAVHRPVYLFHLAAQVFGLGGNLAHQLSALSVNTVINENVFLAAVDHPPRKIFFAGTVASYPHPYRSLPLREDSLFDGLPHYGEFGYASAKRHALNYLTLLEKERGIKSLCGLLTNLYGPEDRFDPVNGHVVPSLVRKIFESHAQRRPLYVWGDGQGRRDFMHVADAADAIVLAFEKTEGTVNIATGQSHSICDVVDCLVESSGFAGEVVWQTDKPTGIADRSVCVDRLAGLGFVPSQTLASGLSDVYGWYAANHQRARQ